ncbi:MAG: hypothetical protein JO041_07640, partial [Acidobacteria bacterium]|nr:hypothetical protein [Acidobacteriota bacterium]
EARVTHRGKSVGYIECEIVDEAGKRIATVNSTCLVLRGDMAKGR